MSRSGHEGKEAVVTLIKIEGQEAIGSVAELEKTCFRHPWTPEMIVQSILTGLDTWLILKEEEEAVGFCAFRSLSGEGELFRIGVAPAFRGRGYGKKLMDGMVEYAKKNGVESMILEVRESNEMARNLYKSYGFKEVNIRKSYYSEPNEAAVIMWNRRISNIYH